MAEYTADVEWRNDAGAEFAGNRYGRAHTWTFDGGTVVRASSSPHVVPPPMSAEDAVDPEEAFVASIASCHMLWFLSIAAKQGFRVDAYRDRARGRMSRNGDGRTAITSVVLSPVAHFAGERQPSAEELKTLHDTAHESCFIASSVRSDIRIQL